MKIVFQKEWSDSVRRDFLVAMTDSEWKLLQGLTGIDGPREEIKPEHFEKIKDLMGSIRKLSDVCTSLLSDVK